MVGSKKLYSGDQATAIFIFGIVCGLILAFLFSLLIGGEQHFKITKEGVKVEEIVLKEVQISNMHYTVLKPMEMITIGWLNENCEPINLDCKYVFDKTKRFVMKDKEAVAKTYEGLIWFEKQKDGSEISFFCPSTENCFKQVCEEPNEYMCGDYLVETWEQIK